MRLLLSELIFASNAMRIADIIFSWNIFSTYELDVCFSYIQKRHQQKNMILIAWEKKSRVGDTMKNQNRKNKTKQQHQKRPSAGISNKHQAYNYYKRNGRSDHTKASEIETRTSFAIANMPNAQTKKEMKEE